MTITQYRKRWLKQHSQYEKIAYKIFIKHFREISNNIPFTELTEENYIMLIEQSITTNDFIKAYYEMYKDVGIIHGKRIGKSINEQIKDFTLSNFLSLFDKRLLTWLLQNSAYRITTVRLTLIKYIQEVIAFGISDGKSIGQIVNDLKKLINSNNYYRWQMLRIVRTETTAAANYAATTAAEVSGVIVEKVWISSQDVRTRRPPKSIYNHFNMNGIKVGQFEKFNVNGDFVLYPGDPKGAASNTINCRCSASLVVKRDKDGRIIRTDRFV